MSEELKGKRIAFVVADEGVEQIELTEPWDAVKEAGGEPVLLSPGGAEVQAMKHLDKADTFHADLSVAAAAATDFDGVVLPGGVANPDLLRMDAEAVGFVREAVDEGLPVAAICHGPWTLIEADVVRDRTITAWPSLRTDIQNAGGTWVDREVMVSTDGVGAFVTSRKPDDLPAFTRAMVEAFAEA